MPMFAYCPVCRRNHRDKPRKHAYTKVHVSAAQAWYTKLRTKCAGLRYLMRHPVDRRAPDTRETTPAVTAGTGDQPPVAGGAAVAGAASASSRSTDLPHTLPSDFWCSACDVGVKLEHRFVGYVPLFDVALAMGGSRAV